MRTRCPNCKTLFRVGIEALELADGLVRCGQCLCVFQARADTRGADQDMLTGSPLPEESARPRSGDTDPYMRSLDESLVEDREDALLPEDDDLPEVLAEREEPALTPPETDWPTDNSAPQHTGTAPDEDRPELMLHDLASTPERPAKPRWMGATLFGVNLLLALVLLGQAAWYQREALAGVDWLQPLLAGGCEALGCQIPVRRDLDGIQLLDRSVSSHPNVDNALVISATMVNNAAFRQPFPLLMVSMSDIRGQVVARRHFQPAEYLDPQLAADGMVPGAPTAVVLEVTDPGGDAQTFELEFF